MTEPTTTDTFTDAEGRCYWRGEEVSPERYAALEAMAEAAMAYYADPDVAVIPHDCPRCGGKGRSRTDYGWLDSPCEVCGGSGVVVVTRGVEGFTTHPAPLATDAALNEGGAGT